MIKHIITTHVPAGETVWNGYPNGYCTAPVGGLGEAEFYTLYELADDTNCHVGWEWEKERKIYE